MNSVISIFLASATLFHVELEDDWPRNLLSGLTIVSADVLGDAVRLDLRLHNSSEVAICVPRSHLPNGTMQTEIVTLLDGEGDRLNYNLGFSVNVDAPMLVAIPPHSDVEFYVLVEPKSVYGLGSAERGFVQITAAPCETAFEIDFEQTFMPRPSDTHDEGYAAFPDFFFFRTDVDLGLIALAEANSNG